MPKPQSRPWPGAVPGHPSCCGSPCSCSSAQGVSGACPIPQPRVPRRLPAPSACPSRGRGTRRAGVTAARQALAGWGLACASSLAQRPALPPQQLGGPSKGRGARPSVLPGCRGAETASSWLCPGCDVFFLPAGTLGCASVVVGSPVVPLGSAVAASCTIQRKFCHGLEQGKVQITWMLDNEPVAGSQHRGPGGTEVSNLTLPQFNRTQAKLWCWVEWNGTRQRVGMAEIRAGYPPAKPSNLSCVLNLSDYGLTCQWDPGADSHLPTNVALKCARSRAQAVTGCTPQGVHSRCTVPRRLLQLYRQMEIWVSTTNALGTAESEHLCMDPMDVAKLDPPALRSIQSIPFQTDCIALAWEVAPSNAHMELQCELRYRAPEDSAWVTDIVGQAGSTQRCGFLFGTRYHFQMRCRRSLARGYWSEWSPGRNYTTHEKAPTGKLDAWWSARPAGAGRLREVQLRWKAPRRQEANGRVLGYRVTLSPRRRGRDPPTICNTTHTQCNFSAPAGTRRVYLSAYNAAGESAATEVVLLERKGQPLAGLRAVPGGERSLWVRWEAPPVPPVTYVLEWQRVPSEPEGCSVCWQMEHDGAATAALIRGKPGAAGGSLPSWPALWGGVPGGWHPS
uniref:Fibronectin type-III domain-containing protein n=1 Tax=Strix occidentalis caurina TaxID=311401 RepID=A0A8D0EIM0_STROC